MRIERLEYISLLLTPHTQALTILKTIISQQNKFLLGKVVFSQFVYVKNN